MAEKAQFTVKVGDRPFTIDRITLGDWRTLKTEFGLNASDITTVVTTEKGDRVEILNLDDPNVLVGLMVVALRHERPHAPMSALLTEVEGLSMDELELFPDSDEDEPEENPTPAADSAATDGPSSGGKSVKRQKKPGTPR